MPKIKTEETTRSIEDVLKKLRKYHLTLTVGIVGSRRRDTDEDFRTCLKAFQDVFDLAMMHGFRRVLLVSGGCPKGADRFAEIIAKEYGYTITIHYPSKALNKELLKVNPRVAYAEVNYARNSLIAEDSDILIALPAPDRKGGTEDTIKKVRRKLGNYVILV